MGSDGIIFPMVKSENNLLDYLGEIMNIFVDKHYRRLKREQKHLIQ